MPNRKAKLTLALAAALLAGHSTAQSTDTKPTDTKTEPASATSESMPDAYDILEKHVEAIGGKDAWMEVEALWMTGEFEMPAYNMKGPMEVALAAPNKRRVVVEVPGMGKVYEGTNGEVAWDTAMPGQPSTMKEGEELEEEIKDADFHLDFQPRKKYPNAEVVGLVTYKDQKAYKLELESHIGEKSVAYFDAETGYLVKQELSEGNMTTEFSDYEDAGNGMMVARTMKVSSPMFEQVMRFHTVEIDPDFPKDTFDPPGAL